MNNYASLDFANTKFQPGGEFWHYYRKLRPCESVCKDGQMDVRTFDALSFILTPALTLCQVYQQNQNTK